MLRRNQFSQASIPLLLFPVMCLCISSHWMQRLFLHHTKVGFGHVTCFSNWSDSGQKHTWNVLVHLCCGFMLLPSPPEKRGTGLRRKGAHRANWYRIHHLEPSPANPASVSQTSTNQSTHVRMRDQCLLCLPTEILWLFFTHHKLTRTLCNWIEGEVR